MLLALVAGAEALAQDIIVMNDGSTMASKVLEITTTEVKYKKYSNLNGPTYTVPVSTISYINYENGQREEFGKSNTKSDAKATTPEKPTPQPSAKSTQSGWSQPEQGQQAVSDVQLMNMYTKRDYEKFMRRSKVYKRTAWIGLGVCVATSVIIGVAIQDDYNDNDYKCYISGACVGAVWCGSFLRASHYQKKRAEEILYLSSGPLLEQELLKIGNTELRAGVDFIRDNRYNNNALGLGFRLQF